MQDNLPDIAPVTLTKASAPQKKPNIFADDKRLVKLILLIGFALLVVLGIAASILEQVAPRGGKTTKQAELFSANLWQIKAQPNQIILGFFEDKNNNGQFDYQEKPFAKVSAAIRRAGESEPFRRVSAERDGLVKIDDLSLGDYEISLDNYSEGQTGDWLFFEEYQQGAEFLPTAWRRVTLAETGYQELIGLIAYRPKRLLVLLTDAGLSWYDPERAREFGKSTFTADFFLINKNVFYLETGKLKKLDWSYRSWSEEMIWLEEAENSQWWLSPEGKTVAYLNNGQLYWRSREEDCREGGLLFEGERPKVELTAFFSETSWLAAGEKLFKVSCQQVESIETVGQAESLGVLTGGSWFYSTGEATYLVDNSGQTVKYTALGGGKNITVSADGRYLLKKLAAGSWLAVDYPAVKASGVEKHYLLTGISGEPTIIGDAVYFVRAKPCEADGDCGEAVKIKLEGSGTWSVDATWDLKNVAATKVLGVVE